MRVLVLGGYGNFGARICRALCRNERFEIVVGGRDLQRAKSLSTTLPNSRPLALNHVEPRFATELERAGIDLVIHAAGPFQNQPYDVALAAARAGAHYIDLADGRRFVCDFRAALNEEFAKAQRVAISGASTVPALSSAVVNALCHRWRQIDTIDVCIAPAQSAPRGVATLAGVLSCCGSDIDVWLDGHWRRMPGWCDPQRVTFRELRPRLGAICDAPDLELFPTHYSVSQRAVLLAALEVPWAQRSLALLGRLRRKNWIRHPERFAAALARAGALFDPFGSTRGGMYVRVTGVDHDDAPRLRTWHITASNNSGPEIPCMPSVLLTHRLAKGNEFSPGAYACVGLLALAEFSPEFARWDIVTEIVDGPLE